MIPRRRSSLRAFRRAGWRTFANLLARSAAFVAIWATAALAGCGGLPSIPGLGGGGAGDDSKPKPRARVAWVSVAAVPGVNGNWPVPVELVRVRDEALVDVLLATETQQWFDETGDAFRLAHPDAVFDAWEVVPGTAVEAVKVRRRGRFGGVLFCGLREAPPPTRVTHRGRIRITVDDNGCTVSRATRAAGKQPANGDEAEPPNI